MPTSNDPTGSSMRENLDCLKCCELLRCLLIGNQA
jgi:hypothetical protein